MRHLPQNTIKSVDLPLIKDRVVYVLSMFDKGACEPPQPKYLNKYNNIQTSRCINQHRRLTGVKRLMHSYTAMNDYALELSTLLDEFFVWQRWHMFVFSIFATIRRSASRTEH